MTRLHIRLLICIVQSMRIDSRAKFAARRSVYGIVSEMSLFNRNEGYILPADQCRLIFRRNGLAGAGAKEAVFREVLKAILHWQIRSTVPDCNRDSAASRTFQIHSSSPSK